MLPARSRQAGCPAPRARRAITLDDGGFALPMALMTLLLLTSLALAFVSLATTEPAIANNHLLAARARAMAESGIERAVWALTNATAVGGFGGAGVAPNVTIAAGATAPYDGSIFIALGPPGGFHLTLTGADPNLRIARAVGRSPAGDPGDPRAKSQGVVVAILARVRNLAREIPCALCAGSALALSSTVVDARAGEATDCGGKAGVAAAGDVDLQTGATILGDVLQRQTLSFFLTADDLETLKGLAIQHGRYVRPASNTRLELLDLASGIVFIDSPSGTNALTATNVAEVAVGPGFATTTPFRGWLVVNGNVTLEAGADIEGLVYAANAIVTEGPATVAGALIARQTLGASALSLADLSVRFDCAAARGSGLLPAGWFVRLGSYCDGTQGC